MVACEHKSRIGRCRICSPQNFCKHGRILESSCKECGRGLCEHGKRKQFCKECGGSIFCNHGKQKQLCKECGGSQLCKHKRRKNQCIECDGALICPHKRLRNICIECNGTSICEHKKIRNRCVECKGTSICKHGKDKYSCKDCDGNGICEHKKERRRCLICNPMGYFIKIHRDSLRRVFSNTQLIKNNKSIIYLGCSKQEFYNYITSKLTPEMKEQGFHLDHIKPISKFNLNNIEELKKCCHYTNLQPLLGEDNLSKSNKWSEEEEKFWNENVIFKNEL